MSDEGEKGIRAALGAMGEILSVTFGRPEAPGQPGRVLIEVTSAHDRMPMLGIGDVVELRYLGPAAKRARKKQQDPKEGT